MYNQVLMLDIRKGLRGLLPKKECNNYITKQKCCTFARQRRADSDGAATLIGWEQWFKQHGIQRIKQTTKYLAKK